MASWTMQWPCDQDLEIHGPCVAPIQTGCGGEISHLINSLKKGMVKACGHYIKHVYLHFISFPAHRQRQESVQPWCLTSFHLLLGHNGVVRCIAHSPVGPAFVSCSDDYRARFWYRKTEAD